MSQRAVKVAVLGKTEIQLQGIRLTPESERQFGLGLYLCATGGREVPRDDLATLFWPEHDLEAARHCLRQSVYRLKVLGVPVRSSAKAIAVSESAVDSDYSRSAVEGANAPALLALEDVTVLPGYAPRFSIPFTEWVDGFRVDVASRLRRALVRAIADARSRGRYADVEQLSRKCLTLDPLNEEATLALAEAVALAGGKAEAVGMIDRYRAEVGTASRELRISANLLRERVSDMITFDELRLGEAPFVGRTVDMERVVQWLQRVRTGNPLPYLISGTSGVGKTRLAIECSRVAQLHGLRVVFHRAPPSNRSQPLSSISEIASQLMLLPGALGSSPGALHCLRRLNDARSLDDGSMSLAQDSRERFASVRWALLDLFDAVVGENPLLLIIDDLQFVDAPSVRLAEDIGLQFGMRPLGLLFASQDFGVSAGSAGKAFVAGSAEHRLEPLSADACAELLSSLDVTFDEGSEADIRQQILQLAGGNPFLLIELARHRREFGAHCELPVGIRSLLEHRVASLSATAVRTLEAVSVLDRDCSLPRLERMVAGGGFDLVGALDELQRAAMTRVEGDRVLCQHESLQTLVFSRMSAAGRSLTHLRAARIMSRDLLRSGTVAELWRCVDHWKLAGRPGSAARVATSLAERLLTVGLASDASSIVSSLAVVTKSRRQRLRMQLIKARAALSLRDWPGLLEHARRGQRLQRNVGPRGQHSLFELLALESAYYCGRDTVRIAKKITACVECPDASLRHRLDAALFAVTVADNSVERDLARSAFEFVRSLPPQLTTESVRRVSVMMIYHSCYGEMAESAKLAKLLAQRALRLKDPAARSLTLRRSARALSKAGEYKLAVGLAVEALGIARHLEIRSHVTLSLELLGHMAIDVGDLAEARRWIDLLRGELNGHSLDDMSHGILHYLESRYALETGDPSLLLDFDLDRQSKSTMLVLRRPTQCLLASAAAAKLVRGQVREAEPQLAKLRELYPELRDAGLQDFPMAVLALGTELTSTHADARDLVSSYLRDFRRETGPLPRSLLRFCSAT